MAEAASGGRTWWAHFALTRINITPTILHKKIEERRGMRESRKCAFPAQCALGNRDRCMSHCRAEDDRLGVHKGGCSDRGGVRFSALQ